MILTWAGVGMDTPWLWLAAFVVPIVGDLAGRWSILARTRVAHDARERARLRIG